MMMHPADQLVFSTVRLVVTKPEGKKVGTGFLVCFEQLSEQQRLTGLVTNKHVLENGEFFEFHMNRRGDGGKPEFGDHFVIPLEAKKFNWLPHPSEDVDLAVLPMGPISKTAQLRGTPISWYDLPVDLIASEDFLTQLSAVEDVIMVGYPGGLWDEVNNQPIVRRGITATPPYRDFQGEKVFLIDCGSVPGSSGSPVFLYNAGAFVNKAGKLEFGLRCSLLGVLCKGRFYPEKGEIGLRGQPTHQDLVSVTKIPLNIGHCVKANELLVFRTLLMEMAEAKGEI
jgi:hypothetical protein